MVRWASDERRPNAWTLGWCRVAHVATRVRADVDIAGRDESAGHGVEGDQNWSSGAPATNSALAATEDA